MNPIARTKMLAHIKLVKCAAKRFVVWSVFYKNSLKHLFQIMSVYRHKLMLKSILNFKILRYNNNRNLLIYNQKVKIRLVEDLFLSI